MSDMIQTLENNPLILSLICALTGYLFGSVSFARIVYYSVTKSHTIEPYAEPVKNSDEKFETDFVSASLVNKRLGAGYGCLTSIADILKVAVPMVIARILFKTEPYFLIIPVTGIIGHYLPLYHGFVGGRGETIMLGSMFVINWPGAILVTVVSTILGFITGNVVVLRFTGYILMIFWVWFHFNDYRYALCMFLLNFLFWFSMRKEVARFYELYKKGLMEKTQEEMSEDMFMGRGLGRAIDRYGLPSLWRKFRNKGKNTGSDEVL